MDSSKENSVSDLIVDFHAIEKYLPHWSWHELLFGIEKDLLTYDDVIKYAFSAISEDIENIGQVVELSLSDKFKAEKLLKNLVDLENDQNIDDIISKWAFAIIYTAYVNDCKDIFALTDCVYAEFDYPEGLRNLIPYEPATDGRTLSEHLTDYIIAGKNKWVKE